MDEVIYLFLKYFDEKSKISKLLILIFDGEDYFEGAAVAVEEVNKLGMKIIIIGVGIEKGGIILLKENGVVRGY